MQKRTMKKLFSLALCIVLLLAVNGQTVMHANASGVLQYNVSEGNVVISSDGDYRITGETGTYAIEIEAGVNANITLDHVSVTTDASSLKSPFKIADNSTGNVVITLEGENILMCNAADHAALQKNGTGGSVGSLTIQGTGSLTAVGGGEAAAIGGGSYGASSGNIIINSGIVTATGGYWAAGIGGASGGTGDNITINGGIVKAAGGNLGAGIGGGSAGAGSNITINGGVVEAVGGAEGAGIGGGNTVSGSSIIISGGVVTAEAEGRDAIDASGGQSAWRGIVFQNGAGLVYGDTLKLTSNVTVPAGKTLTIETGQTLTVTENVILSVAGTVTNNGIIKEYGEIQVTGAGSVGGNAPQKRTESIAFNRETVSLLLGESVVLTAVTTPQETLEDVIWSSQDEQIVSVKDNGKTAELKAEKAGKAVITAKAGDISTDCIVTVNKLKGTATVTVADIYCGKTPVVQMESTNGTGHAAVEYISLDEADAVYTSETPKSCGKYRVKVTFPETEEYTGVEASADFQIKYLPIPESPYKMSGTKGKNGFYTSKVTIKPKTGYQISTQLDKAYGDAVVFSASQENARIYLMNSEGEKTDAVRVNSFKIDTAAPDVGADNHAVFYADKVEITVNDNNLSKVLVNGDEIKFTGTFAKISLKAGSGKKKYQIVASDLAGNETKVDITVAASWMEDGVIPSGMSIHLMKSQPYMLGSGKWKVSGDETTYTGAQDFYVGSDGDYVFTKQ